MTTATWTARPAEPIQVPTLAWPALIIGLIALYLVFQENGTFLANSWETLHEFFHDARHAFGVPCH
ncbi:MAG: CbtB-domain containing protein [Actinomycetota bacterium]